MHRNAALTACRGAALRRAYKNPAACPVATQDVQVNLKNRNEAIKQHEHPRCTRG